MSRVGPVQQSDSSLDDQEVQDFLNVDIQRNPKVNVSNMSANSSVIKQQQNSTHKSRIAPDQFEEQKSEENSKHESIRVEHVT